VAVIGRLLCECVFLDALAHNVRARTCKFIHNRSRDTSRAIGSLFWYLLWTYNSHEQGSCMQYIFCMLKYHFHCFSLFHATYSHGPGTFWEHHTVNAYHSGWQCCDSLYMLCTYSLSKQAYPKQGLKGSQLSPNIFARAFKCASDCKCTVELLSTSSKSIMRRSGEPG